MPARRSLVRCATSDDPSGWPTYALPVVVVTTVAVTAWRGWDAHRAGRSDPWRRAAARGTITLGVAALVVGPWVAVLSVDADSPTLSRSAGYDLSDRRTEADGQPVATGLVKLPYEGALFAWEDPSSLPARAGTAGTPEPTVARLTSNLMAGVEALAGQFPAVLALAAMGAWVALRRPGLLAPTPLAALLVVVVVYVSGYAVIAVQGRFLWFAVLALAPLVATAIDLPFLRPSLEPGQAGYARRRVAGFVIFALLLGVQAGLSLGWETEGRDVVAPPAGNRPGGPACATAAPPPSRGHCTWHSWPWSAGGGRRSTWSAPSVRPSPGVSPTTGSATSRSSPTGCPSAPPRPR
jgi:hypothetical protein